MDVIGSEEIIPAVVLWDMDGTLIDSEEYWIAAETRLVERFGGKWSHEKGARLVGNSLDNSAIALQQAGVDLTVQEIIAVLLRHVSARLDAKIPYRPGCEALLERCRQAGIRMGLVTMSHAPVADIVINNMPHKYFDIVVTGDRVRRGKPDPEPYRKAYAMMEKIVPGLKKSDVVVIEDSIPGVKSAMAAGLKTIAVPNVVGIPESLASVTWDSLEDKGIEHLAQVAR